MTSVVIEQHEELSVLLDRGQYKSALRAAEQRWGSVDGWKEREQLSTLRRINRGLGRHRSAKCLDIVLHRRFPNDSNLALNHFFANKHHLSVLESLEYIDSWIDKSPDVADSADWLILKAQVLARVRDFVTAHALIDDVLSRRPDYDWALGTQITLFAEEGHREKALAIAKERYLATGSPRFFELYVQFTQRVSGSGAALTLIENSQDDFEVLSLLRAAVRCCLELSLLDKAKLYLEKSAELQVLGVDKGDKFEAWSMVQIGLEQRDLSLTNHYLAQMDDPFSERIKTKLDGKHCLTPIIKLPVPHITQKHMTCAPSSLAAICQFWGMATHEDQIASEICFDGSPDHLQREWLTHNGLHFIDFELTEAAAIEVLSAGIPFTLVTTSGLTSHLQVVKGIDIDAGYLYLMDPSCAMESKILLAETIESEGVNGAKCRAIVPQNKKALFSNLDPLPASDLIRMSQEVEHFLGHQNIALARETIDRMTEVDSEHRLKQLSERSFAIMLNDELQVHYWTELLLEKYPGTCFLILSMYESKKRLDNHQSAYLWLHEQFKEYGFREVYRVLLEDMEALSSTDPVRDEINKINVAWDSADFFRLKADQFWLEQEKERAAKLYFWSLCLEPSDSTNIQKYALALNQLGRGQEALDKVESLYQSAIHVSPDLAYSLYRLHCMDDQFLKGLSILGEALEHHPSDHRLLKYYLSELCSHGKQAEAQQVFGEFKTGLTARERIEMEAVLAIEQGDNALAVSLYKQLLKEQPNHVESLSNLCEALKRQGLKQEANELLQDLVDRPQAPLSILQLVADKGEETVLVKHAVNMIVERFPLAFSSAIQLAYIHLYNDEMEQAQLISKSLIEKDKGNPQVWALAADIAQRKANWGEAKQFARKGFELSPNRSYYFDVLMRSVPSPESKKQLLEELVEFFENAPSVNEGLWAFWETAKLWLSAEVLDSFCNAITDKHPTSWCAWVISAYRHEMNSNLELSIDDLGKAVSCAPLVARVYLEQGRIYSLLDKNREAETAFATGHKIARDWPVYAIEYYRYFEKIGDIKQGLSILEMARKFNEGHAELLVYIAACYNHFERYETALELYIEAVESQFNYEFAWQELKKLSEYLDGGKVWNQVLQKRIEEYPNNIDTWIISAMLTKDHTQRKSHLLKALDIQPTHIGANYDLALLYAVNREIDQLSRLVRDSKWGGSAPITIALTEPEALYNQGKYQEALEILVKLSLVNANVPILWELKLKSEIKLKQLSDAQHSADRLEAVSYDDQRRLLTVIEFYRDHGEFNEGKIASLFHQAYLLDTTNANTAFEYLDFCIEMAQVDKAINLIDAMAAFHKGPWLEARKFHLAVDFNNSDIGDPLKLYENIVDSGCHNFWIYENPLSFVHNVEACRVLFQNMLSLIEKKLTSKSDSYLIDVYVKYRYQGLNFKEFEYTLAQEQESYLWKAICELYLDKCLQGDALPSEAFWNQHHDQILLDPHLSGLKGQLLLHHSQFYQAIAHYKEMKLDKKIGVRSYIYFHAAFASAQVKDYQFYNHCMENYLESERDDTFERGLVWYGYHLLMQGETLPIELLGNIDQGQLGEIEQNMYELIQIILRHQVSRDNNKNLEFEHLTKVSRDFKFVDHVVNDVKKSVIKRLVETSELTGWSKKWYLARLIWRFRK